MRKYEVIWEKIKHAPFGKQVEVTFSTLEQMQTIINMVQLEKSRAQVNRKKLDLPMFGKLVIVRRPKELKLFFSLKDSGDAL